MRFLQRLQLAGRVDRETFLLQVAAHRRVLHMGCVDSGLLASRLASGTLLHDRLRKIAAELWGLDTDAEGIERLKDLGFRNLYSGSAEQPPPAVPRRYFDVVIAGEIIEHVRNAGRFLDSTAQLLADDGRIVITTPNALRFYNPFPAIVGRELTHPDHISWYSPHTLRRAVELSAFRIEAIHVYNQAPSVMVSRESSLFHRSFRRAINVVGPAVHGSVVCLFPYLSDGLVLVGRVGKARRDHDCQH